MIPIKDENPTRTTPYVVYVLLALNIFLFLVDWLGTERLAPGIEIGGLWNYTMIPAEIVRGDVDLPAQITEQVMTPAGPRMRTITIPHESPSPAWITIFTSMFLHGGLLHLGGNMLYLWIFGNNIEDVLGHAKFLLFYLLGGVVAAAGHIISDPSSQVPTLGASGAIAAVLGAYMILYPNHRIISLVFLGFFVTTVAVPAVVVLGLWIVLQIVSATIGGGMTPGGGGVAYWAHIGGFLAGIMLIFLFGGRGLLRGRRDDRRFHRSWYED